MRLTRREFIGRSFGAFGAAALAIERLGLVNAAAQSSDYKALVCVFLFGGKYWSHHNDVWFVAPRPGARWTRVAVTAVPHEVRAVPVTYYKVKPKHAKGMKEHEGRGCPPGLAKQGRC